MFILILFGILAGASLAALAGEIRGDGYGRRARPAPAATSSQRTEPHPG